MTYTTTTAGEKDLVFNTPLAKGYELTYNYEGGGGSQILGNILIDSFSAPLQYYYWGYDSAWKGRKQPNNASFTSQESQPVAGDTIRIISTMNGAIKLYCNDNLIIEGITVYEKLYFGLYTNQNRLQKISNLKIKKVS